MTTSRTPRTNDQYVLTSEVAEILQVSPKTIARWAKEGKLPFARTLGGHRRYPLADIEQLARDLQQPGQPVNLR